ncbi:tyrosinase precursor [Colletotrichum sojae]|uniref:tyrosinase n=1 Tax=Colletotrichum sojae TaxID=2175907 RepID=A0A8H6JDF9_9PEZI|nr:tyrosinase precursor [Colletotrichum sojae]
MDFRIAVWLFIVLLAATATAAPAAASLSTYNYGFDARKLAKRQTKEPIVVSKLPLINGTVPLRPEVRQMKQNPYKWNLYLLSMSMLQYTDQDEELSWYQIAGIHGVPFVPWNDVPGVVGGENRGYCTHMSTLFPPWHRVYLALFEHANKNLSQQVLFRLVQMIATWFTDSTERALYEAAAADFRMPYWDWAMTPPEGESSFLPDFETPGIQVYGPNGLQFIANPLYSYKFRPLDTKVFSEGDFPTWTETKRAPFETTDNRSVAHSIDHARPALQQRLYTLLSNYKDYGPFSNKYWGTATNRSQFDSVEALHDAMHVLVGNRGHMYYIQYSAFDPVFFLHHTMADRIVALWQALYPNSWVTSQVAMEHSFTMPSGTVQDMFTDLKPFFANNSGAFWNSAMARETTPFGYSYAETVLDDRARLIATINRLYGGSSPSALVHKRRRASPEENRRHAAQIRKGTLLSDEAEPDFSRQLDFTANVVAGDNHYTEWIANVHVRNDALNGSFMIHLFFGNVPENPDFWSTAPNLVGSMNVFAMKSMGSGNQVSGTVPLTAALVHMVSIGVLAGLEPDEIEPYLQRYLQVRVFGDEGVEVKANSVESLYVQIASSQVQAARYEWEFPHWGPVVERFVLELR